MKTLAVIPARYDSVRFPGKPLALLHGRPMIQRVWERAKASIVDRVIVATDDERIVEACGAFGAECVMTDRKHTSGTSRVMQVAEMFPEYPYIVNVQGDEPLIESTLISTVASALERHGIVTVSTAVPVSEASSPNSVKVVMDDRYRALYFSRAVIPYNATSCNLHIGIYGFRRSALMGLKRIQMEHVNYYAHVCENLEQLKWMIAGCDIRCYRCDSQARGVDTPEELERLNANTH